MAVLLRSVCLTTLFLAGALSANLPDYVTTCKRNDPDLNECVKKNAIAALPSILKGDKAIKLPNLLPYHLPAIDINAGGNIKLSFKNCVLDGLQNIVMESAKADVEKHFLGFTGSNVRLNLEADYRIDGRILVLPITGSGKSNITMVGIKFEYSMDFDLMKRDDGKEYIKVKKSVLTFDPERTYYDLENLFNGDKVLGPEMNKLLNENHKEVAKDLNPALTDVVDTIITHILNTVIENAPYDEIFPVS